MKGSATEKLRRFYSQFFNDDHVLILIEADPDSIASAMAVKRLLWRKAASVTISNVNVIKRPDNLAMIQLLKVNLVATDQVDKSRYSRFVLVDSQPCHDDRFARFSFHIIIDHHPDSGITAPFVDIRPQYGASASIMTEYLRAAKIKPSTKLASALFHAIKTDTSNFERQTIFEDIRAFQYLFRHANIHLTRKIEQAEISYSFLKYFNIALQKKRKRKGRLFAHLGPVANPDACVVVADFFARIQNITWTIVSGMYNGTLVIIIRNDGLRKDAGNLAHNSFGAIGSAGGHKGAARAEIPLKALKTVVDVKDGEQIQRWIISQVEKKAGKT